MPGRCVAYNCPSGQDKEVKRLKSLNERLPSTFKPPNPVSRHWEREYALNWGITINPFFINPMLINYLAVRTASKFTCLSWQVSWTNSSSGMQQSLLQCFKKTGLILTSNFTDGYLSRDMASFHECGIFTLLQKESKYEFTKRWLIIHPSRCRFMTGTASG